MFYACIAEKRNKCMLLRGILLKMSEIVSLGINVIWVVFPLPSPSLRKQDYQLKIMSLKFQSILNVFMIYILSIFMLPQYF